MENYGGRAQMESRHSILWRRLSPPLSGARVNLCVLWVGRQLSLLGGRERIATTQCDRRRATIASSAYARSPKFTRAACPQPTLPDARLRADVQATPVDHPGLKH